jgi:hypothetical protein
MKHNKKRNIGLIYELLLRNVSANLVEDNKKKASKTLRIIEKRFNNNTELYKEFRIFNALIKTNASSELVANQILVEAKDAIRRSDRVKIDREKSRLIRDINHIVQDKSFYYRKIDNYRDYGTIQQLFNEWAKGDKSNLKNVLELEEKVTKMLIEVKNKEAITDIDPALTDRLVVDLMTEKLNKRYNSDLNDEQKQIIQNYSLYCNNENHSEMRKYLITLKENTVSAMNEYKIETDSAMLEEKLDTVIRRVELLDTNKINDELVAKFMTVSQLHHEILKEGK